MLRRHHLPDFRAAGLRVVVLAIWCPRPVVRDDARAFALEALAATRAACAEADEELTIVTTCSELDAALDRGAIAGVLAIEGCEPLDGDPARIHEFAELGVRLAGLTWNDATPFAGGAVDGAERGLSDLGFALLDEMAAAGVGLDLAHLPPPGVVDAVGRARVPLAASHANAATVWPSARNLADDAIAAIAACDGVIGVNAVPAFLGRGDPIAQAVAHHDAIVRAGGPGCVAIGADLIADFVDYASIPAEEHAQYVPPDTDADLIGVREPPRRTFYGDLCDAVRRRHGAEAAAALASGNALRFLRRVLSARGDGAAAIRERR